MTALRAFAVTEHDENTGGVYFARHDIVAKKAGAAEVADGDISAVSCRRAPWADAYAGKAVPVRLMIANGWHFECTGCGARIDEYWLEENHLPVDGVIGTQWSAVYCCSRCLRKRLSLSRRRKAEEARAIDAFKAIVRRRLPAAVFLDGPEPCFWRHRVYVTRDFNAGGGWHWEDVVVAFKLPGLEHPATFELSRSWRGYGNPAIGPLQAVYKCAVADKAAFEAYAAATKVRP
jgi:hypothetical protein